MGMYVYTYFFKPRWSAMSARSGFRCFCSQALPVAMGAGMVGILCRGDDATAMKLFGKLCDGVRWGAT